MQPTVQAAVTSAEKQKRGAVGDALAEADIAGAEGLSFLLAVINTIMGMAVA